MAVTKTIGGEPGRDFATPQLAVAAFGVDPDLPTTLTEDITLEIYRPNPDGTGTSYSGNLVFSFDCNGYDLRIKGMVGTLADNTLINIYGSVKNTISNEETPTFENLAIGTEETESAIVYSNVSGTRCINCILIGSCDLRGGSASLINCYIYGNRSWLLSQGSYYVYNCVIVNKSSSGELFIYINEYQVTPYILNCSIYSANVIAKNLRTISERYKNSIIYGVNGVFNGDDSNLSNKYGFIDCCIYSPSGYYINSNPLSSSIRQDILDSANVLVQDPLFKNTSGTFANVSDIQLQSTSPCLPENITPSSSVFISGINQQRVGVGAIIPDTSYDYPNRESVLTTDTTDGEAGLYINPSEEIVKLGENYGYEQTGTYQPSDLPTSPTISVTDNGDGTGVVAALTNCDEESTNYVYYFADAVDVNAVLGATVGCDESAGISITTMGAYYFYAVTETASGYNISENMVRLEVTDIGDDDTTESQQTKLISKYGSSYVIESRTEIKTEDGHAISTWSTKHSITGWMQATSSDIRRKYAKRNITVTHKLFTTTDPTTTMGDRVKDGTDYYLVRGVVNQAGRNVLWRLDLEEEL